MNSISSISRISRRQPGPFNQKPGQAKKKFENDDMTSQAAQANQLNSLCTNPDDTGEKNIVCKCLSNQPFLSAIGLLHHPKEKLSNDQLPPNLRKTNMMLPNKLFKSDLAPEVVLAPTPSVGSGNSLYYIKHLQLHKRASLDLSIPISGQAENFQQVSRTTTVITVSILPSLISPAPLNDGVITHTAILPPYPTEPPQTNLGQVNGPSLSTVISPNGGVAQGSLSPTPNFTSNSPTQNSDGWVPVSSPSSPQIAPKPGLPVPNCSNPSICSLESSCQTGCGYCHPSAENPSSGYCVGSGDCRRSCKRSEDCSGEEEVCLLGCCGWACIRVSSLCVNPASRAQLAVRILAGPSSNTMPKNEFNPGS